MKVLIVDDSSFIVLVCRQTLEKSGYQVVGEAYDGEDAVEKAMAFKPDLVIMDIALPKKNGFEATKEIQARLPKTKILAVSAVDEDMIKEQAISAGCFDFLSKPFESVELLDKIERIKSASGELKYG